MPVDRIASVASLARNLLMATDGHTDVDIKVNTAQLRLVIETFLGLASPGDPKVADVQARTVIGAVAQINAAGKQESEAQAAHSRTEAAAAQQYRDRMR